LYSVLPSSKSRCSNIKLKRFVNFTNTPNTFLIVNSQNLWFALRRLPSRRNYARSFLQETLHNLKKNAIFSAFLKYYTSKKANSVKSNNLILKKILTGILLLRMALSKGLNPFTSVLSIAALLSKRSCVMRNSS